jgi:hypothetical protein
MMSEYELAALTQGQVNTMATGYYYFYSFLSGLLIVSYLIARSLPRAIGILLVVLFVMNQLFLLMVVESQLRALRGMLAETVRMADSGKGFAWLGPVGMPADWYINAPLLILVLSLIGAVFFFFHCSVSRRMQIA